MSSLASIVFLIFYQAAFPLVALFVFIRFVLAGRAASLKESFTDILERLGLGSLPAHGGRTVLWLHAASMGEALSAAPFIAELSRSKEKPFLCMTTSTRAGRDKARTLAGVDAALLAPADILPCVAAFFMRLKPSVLVLAESEFWPMTLAWAAWTGVRLGLVNGKVNERSFRRRLWLKPFFFSFFASFERVAAQSQADAERLLALGVKESGLKVCGNMKYDAAVSAAQGADIRAKQALSRLRWDGFPLWVAASTRPGEEELIIDAHRLASAQRPDLRLVLAPRHPERAEEVQALLQAKRLSFARLSLVETRIAAPQETACLLIDGLGALSGFFGPAVAAFVGATLVPLGGHNLLEPAGAGCPVLFGPHTETIMEPAQALESSGGGTRVRSADDIAKRLGVLLSSSFERASASAKAAQTAAAFSGATQRTLSHLAPLL
ncbi:MAG: glycosyltransferase N-terminal domain-containing protein [Elusimicrobiota bacterium]|jgi:3-deoxy-D-manno-octulosonic-acid transferase